MRVIQRGGQFDRFQVSPVDQALDEFAHQPGGVRSDGIETEVGLQPERSGPTRDLDRDRYGRAVGLNDVDSAPTMDDASTCVRVRVHDGYQGHETEGWERVCLAPHARGRVGALCLRHVGQGLRPSLYYAGWEKNPKIWVG